MAEIYGSATDEDRKRLKSLREQYIALSKEVEDVMGRLLVGNSPEIGLMRRSGNDQDATSASDPGAGQRAPSARPECEQRRHYCQGSKPDHFCGTPPGKHTEASIEKDCEVSQTDLIRRSSSSD